MVKRLLRVAIIVVVLGSIGVGAWLYYDAQRRKRLPEGIVGGNGRIESVQVDVASKYAGRIVEILAHEGDLVRKGQVLARMDVLELEAQLASAQGKIAEAQESDNQIKAEILEREAMVRYQDQEFARNRELFSRRVVSREEMEKSQTKRDISKAAVDSVKAKLAVNARTIQVAEANVKNIEAQIADSTLISPVDGRVLYRLAEEREVLAAGGKVLTLINLDDVYMEIFLSSETAARVEIGAEGRIVLDAYPKYYAPANVTFVSPEAQFTPKQVETRTERDKLMFRVKLKVPEQLILPYIEKIKTGVRGMGYVRLDPATAWPANLDQIFPRLKPGETPAAPAEPGATDSDASSEAPDATPPEPTPSEPAKSAA